MLGAIAKEVAKGAAAAADKVTDLLPGKGGSDKDTAEGDDVRRDQDQGELAPAGDEQQVSEEPMISGDSEIDAPSSKNAVQDEPSATAAEATGEAPPANESDNTPAINDDQVNMPTPASGSTDQDDSKLLQAPVVVDTESKDTASKGKPGKGKASKKGDTAKTSTDARKQTEPADQGAKQQIDNPQLTEGSKQQPKMAKGRSKWMKNSSAWYPDSAGILHAPGVYINKRKPFRGWGDAPTYKDIGEYLGIQEKAA